MKVNDLTGQRFERLIVIARAGSTKAGLARWLCRCDCGQEKIVTNSNLRLGHVKSCGCYNRELVLAKNFRHGHAGRDRQSAEYICWARMKDRCFKPESVSYKYYGARGITVCAEWNDSFEAFLRDMGRKPSPRLTIERKDNDGNYEPGNCKWATRLEQRHNRRDARPAA